MVYEQRLSIPLTGDFSVNVQIRISPNGSGYTAEVQAEGSNWQFFPIGLLDRDVEAINSELQKAIQDVSGCFNESDGTFDDTFDDTLAQLARKGKYAFNQIFQQGLLRKFISGALKLPATIQFSSEKFFIPWELLYNGPLDKVDITYFWGMRHIVTRVFTKDFRPGEYVPSEMQASCPRVGLIAYEGERLPHIAEEISVLKTLDKDKKICLLPLGSMNSSDPGRHHKELKALRRFLQENMQVAHLACHAEVNTEKITESLLFVSNEFPITMEDFVVEEFEIKHKPLVILNACLTGMINPLHTCNWVIKFFERGARGVLATEFQVPDWFAAAFIKELYDNFLSGAPIGKALIDTRRFFWEDKRNPLGLAYALYSSPSIRIKN